MTIDFASIAAAALGSAEPLLRELFPQGRRQGREFRVGNINGDTGDSLKVNLDTGAWKDFANGEKGGGDLVSLWARVRGRGNGEAAREIEAWLGLTPSDSNGHQRSNGKGNARASTGKTANPKIKKHHLAEQRYEICDLDGRLIAVHVCKDFEYLDPETDKWLPGKDLFWQLPSGKAGLGGLPVLDLPLFGAHLIRAEESPGVVICEGEKATAALWKHDIAAVGTCCGAAVMPSDTTLQPLLKFATVTVWPHNDAPGRKHMAAIAKQLHRLGHTDVRMIVWPEAPPKEDAADFNDSDDEFRALIAAALPFDESGETESESGRAKQPVEKWNAPRVAAEIDRDDRFAQDDGRKLYKFKDGAYRPQGEEHIRRRAREIVPPGQWSVHLANETIEYIRVASPRLWETPSLEVLNVRNGLLDLKTRDLRPHSPDYLSMVQLLVAYDPDATCPAWHKQVEETFPADAVLAGVAWQIVAWLMLPITFIQKALLLLGAGGTGKSTFLTALMAFLGGRRNVSNLTLQKIENDRFAAARLIGKFANICADLPVRTLRPRAPLR